MQNSATNHGSLVRVDVQSFDDSYGKYDCVLVFEDGYQHQVLLTRQDIIHLQSDICSRINVAEERDTLRKFSPLPRAAAQEERRNVRPPLAESATSDFTKRIQHVARDAYARNNNSGAPAAATAPAPPGTQTKSTASTVYDKRANDTVNMQQMSLKDYAQVNPQRTRLLNGKLFTPELIKQTQRGGVPEALQ